MSLAAIVSVAGLAVLVVCSALFSAAEAAITSINRTKARALRKSRDVRDRAVVALIDDRDATVTALLVGNNVVNIGAASLATALGMTASRENGALIAAISITAIILVFGEIIPKTLAAENPTRAARALTPLIAAVRVVAKPAVAVFSRANAAFARALARVIPGDASRLTEDELRLMMDAGKRDGALGESEHRLLARAVDFTTRTVREIMTPRTAIAAIRADARLEEVSALFGESGFSRMPVYPETPDKIVGMLHFKDALFAREAGEKTSAKDLMRAIIHVPENMTARDLLTELKRSSLNMAVVVDEHGTTAGLVTMDDALASIIGGIRDEFDVDGDHPRELVKVLGPRHIRVPGNLRLSDLNALMKISLDSRFYETVGGYVMELAERLPDRGESIRDGALLFTVLDRGARTIQRLDITGTEKE